jgi:hypothetical protein
VAAVVVAFDGIDDDDGEGEGDERAQEAVEWRVGSGM